MRYCVLYPNTSNVNLVKEMGMMPYKLHKLYGYDARVACYELDEYDYLENEVKGLKIDFIDKKFNNYTMDGLRYLSKEARNIDILQIFHVTLYSMFYAFRYKRLNPNGKIYLKLDCSHKLIDRIICLSPIQKKILNSYLDKADLISAEQIELCEKLKELLPKQRHKIINIPDGVDYKSLEEKNIKYDYTKKENVILHVARIGTEEKNTPMILEAFKNIKGIENSGWKLVLIGSIEEEFKTYIDKFFYENSNLKDIIEFKGPISDRKKLFEEFNKSKIFCLTSQFESFGIAFVEAAAMGNVIVSTDVGISRELIEKGNGAVVDINDCEGLSNKLQEFINSPELKKHSLNTYELCKEKFDWDKIIALLYENFEKLKVNK